MRRFVLVTSLTLAGLTLAGLAPPPLAGAPPAVHALVGARIVVAAGEVIEKGTVVIRDGVIAAVGPEISPPADARLWELDGLTVYPGLIDPFSPRPRPPEEGKEPGEGDPLPGGHENPLIAPQRDAVEVAGDEAVNGKLRGAGFTTALAVATEGIFRGRGALLNLGDGPVTDNLLAADVAQVAAFAVSGGSSRYPEARMGAVALLRQSLLDAAWQGKAHAAYRQNPAQARPPLSAVWTALQPVAAGSQKVIFDSLNVVDTLRFAAVAQELGLAAWVVGNGEEYQRLPAIQEAGLPHLLPIRFPADPPAGGDKDDLSLGLEELRHWDRAADNPGLLLATGLPVAFTAKGHSDPAKIHSELARAIERGLTADQALTALTVTPARLLGLSDRAGSVEAGKMANLVVVEGDLFVDKAKIREVWIDGRRYPVKESKPPEVDPLGTWEVTVFAGSEQIPVVLVVSGSLESLSAAMTAMGSRLAATSVSVSGKTLEATFDAAGLGQAGDIVLRLTIEGDSASGDAESPMGPARLAATRTAKPSPEVTP